MGKGQHGEYIKADSPGKAHERVVIPDYFFLLSLSATSTTRFIGRGNKATSSPVPRKIDTDLQIPRSLIFSPSDSSSHPPYPIIDPQMRAAYSHRYEFSERTPASISCRREIRVTSYDHIWNRIMHDDDGLIYFTYLQQKQKTNALTPQNQLQKENGTTKRNRSTQENRMTGCQRAKKTQTH